MSRLMMPLAVLGLLFGGLAVTTSGHAAGLEQGDPIGAFYVTKVAGADNDGVEKGEQLCYRCRYGSRPMVMVFARDTDGKVRQLVKKLDAAVAANEDAQFRGLLTLLGDDAAALKDTAAKVAKKTGVKNVPVVVAKDNVGGPSSYKIDKSAAVTVIVASEGKVIASHSFGKTDEVDVAAVMDHVAKIVR